VVQVTQDLREETLDLTLLDEILDEHKSEPGPIIPMLQKAQDLYGYLPLEVLGRISEGLGVPLSQVYGVATFYAQFYLTRRGRNVVRVRPRPTTESLLRWCIVWDPVACRL